MEECQNIKIEFLGSLSELMAGKDSAADVGSM